MVRRKSPPAVIFESINVQSFTNLSGIFIGDNFQCYWESQNKTNTAFGSVRGEKNSVNNPLNYLIDPDQLDNPKLNQKESSEKGW